MKLAWLCYHKNWYIDEEGPVILFEQPEDYLYGKIVPIVWMEIVKL